MYNNIVDLTFRGTDPNDRPVLSLLNVTSDQPWWDTDCHEVTLRDLEWDQSHTIERDYPGSMIHLDGGELFVIDFEGYGVTTNTSGAIFYSHQGGCGARNYGSASMENVYFHDIYANATGLPNEGAVLRMDYSRGVTVRNALFERVGAFLAASCISVQSATAATELENVIIRDCYTIGGDDGQVLTSTAAFSLTNVTFENNRALYDPWANERPSCGDMRTYGDAVGISGFNELNNVRFLGSYTEDDIGAWYHSGGTGALRLRDVHVENTRAETANGGIVIRGPTFVDIDGLTMKNVTALDLTAVGSTATDSSPGAALAINDCSVVARNIHVDSSGTEGNNEGIVSILSSIENQYVQIEDSSLTNGQTGYWGAWDIEYSGGGTSLIMRRVLTENVTALSGGACGEFDVDTILFEDCSCINAQARAGSGAIEAPAWYFGNGGAGVDVRDPQQTPTVVLDGCLIENTVGGDLGAVTFSDSWSKTPHPSFASVRNTVFRGNDGTDQGPGVIIRSVPWGLQMIDCTIENQVGAYGGALVSRAHNSSIWIADMTGENNQATTEGGLIYLAPDFEDVRLYVDGLIAVDNDSDGHGGVIGIRKVQDATLTNLNFVGNSAVVGGGISIVGGGTGGVISISDSTFLSNTAGTGGAINVDTVSSGEDPVEVFEVTDCEFRGNSGGIGGQVNLRDDAIHVMAATFTRTSITEGIGSTLSSGLAARLLKSLDLIDVTISGNSGASSGASGLGLADVANATISGYSVIVNNQSPALEFGVACEVISTVQAWLEVGENVVIVNNTAPGQVSGRGNIFCESGCGGCVDDCISCADDGLGPYARCSPDLDGTCTCWPEGVVNDATGECEGGFFGVPADEDEVVEDEDSTGGPVEEGGLSPALLGAIGGGAVVFIGGLVCLLRKPAGAGADDDAHKLVGLDSAANSAAAAKSAGKRSIGSSASRSTSATLRSARSGQLASERSGGSGSGPVATPPVPAGRRSSQETASSVQSLNSDNVGYVPTRRQHIQAQPAQTVVGGSANRANRPRARSRSRSRGRARGQSHQAGGAAAGGYTTSPVSVFQAARNPDDMVSQGMVSMSSVMAPSLDSDMVSTATDATWSGGRGRLEEVPAPPAVPESEDVKDDDLYM